jgi:hypothetical protein
MKHCCEQLRIRQNIPWVLPGFSAQLPVGCCSTHEGGWGWEGQEQQLQVPIRSFQSPRAARMGLGPVACGPGRIGSSAHTCTRFLLSFSPPPQLPVHAEFLPDLFPADLGGVCVCDLLLHKGESPLYLSQHLLPALPSLL